MRIQVGVVLRLCLGFIVLSLLDHLHELYFVAQNHIFVTFGQEMRYFVQIKLEDNILQEFSKDNIYYEYYKISKKIK